MANITDLTTLGKTSVTANDFFLTANSARGDNKKFGVSNLFPTVQSKSGVTGISLFVDVTDKNVINLKGIKSASSILTVSTTTANDISLDIAEAQINLANCSNSTSGFLSTVALASNVSGTLPVANGGTNATSFADKAVIITQDSGDDTLAA